jgi:hypothetical protein
MSAISKLLAAIVREQVGREGAEAESWRLAALAAREEYSALSDALRQETRLSLALTEQRDEALKQARYGWERHAEKDRSYGEALRQRDEAREALRKLLLSRDAAWTGGHDWQEAIDEALAALGIEGGVDG